MHTIGKRQNAEPIKINSSFIVRLKFVLLLYHQNNLGEDQCPVFFYFYDCGQKSDKNLKKIVLQIGRTSFLSGGGVIFHLFAGIKMSTNRTSLKIFTTGGS